MPVKDKSFQHTTIADSSKLGLLRPISPARVVAALSIWMSHHVF
jgi:hypothetical protein